MSLSLTLTGSRSLSTGRKIHDHIGFNPGGLTDRPVVPQTATYSLVDMYTQRVVAHAGVVGLLILSELATASHRQGAPTLVHQREDRMVPLQYSNSLTNILPHPHKSLSKQPVKRDAARARHNREQLLRWTRLRGGTTSVTPPTISPTNLAHKLTNLGERTLPAVILLLGLLGIVKFFGKAGLSALVLALSPGLYHEMVSVVLNDNTTAKATTTADAVANVTTIDNELPTIQSDASEPASDSSLVATVATLVPFPRVSDQWWWFLAMSLPTTLAGYLQPKVSTATLRLVSYAMMIAGWMAWIVRLNSSTSATPADFRRAVKEVGVYHVAGLFSIIPIHCWMATMSEFATGQSWVLYASMLVVLNDTLAYLFGVTLGKHALLPVISPKKTWEGWIGALVSTTLLSYLVWYVFFPISYGNDSLAVALFCSLVAPLGGFLASGVKRAYGKKDFSNLIAGHGGLVDRLDCQLITAPFVYLLLNALEPVDVFAAKFGHAAIPNL